MNQIDKSSIKRLIDKSKHTEMLVLQIDSLEKDSLKSIQKELEKFVNKSEDYVVIVTKKRS
jgi:hypothetical protein